MDKQRLNEIWREQAELGNGFAVGFEDDCINDIVANGLTLVSPAENCNDIAVYVTDLGNWIGVGGNGVMKMAWACPLSEK